MPIYSSVLFVAVAAFVIWRIIVIRDAGPFSGSYHHLRKIKRSGYGLTFAGLGLPFLFSEHGILPIVYGFDTPSPNPAFAPMLVLRDYQSWLTAMALAAAGIFTFGDEARLRSILKQRKAMIDARNYLLQFIDDTNPDLTFGRGSVKLTVHREKQGDERIETIQPYFTPPRALPEDVQAHISPEALAEISFLRGFTEPHELDTPLHTTDDFQLQFTTEITFPGDTSFPALRDSITSLQKAIDRFDREVLVNEPAQ